MVDKIKITQLLLILIIVFSLSVILFAGQTGKIAGKVIDKETGAALAGANVIISHQWINDLEVRIEGYMIGAATDLNGEYFIINIPPGVYTVRTTYIGYKHEAMTRVKVLVDKTTRVDFYLAQQILAGEEVVVTAYKPESVEIDLTATKQNYDVNEIVSLPGMNDITDIIDLQADVDGGHFRGGRSGEALYLIEGSAIVNPLFNNRAFAPLIIGLEQVEVYTSGFSAEYGNVQSGVINMVAREGRSDKWETHIDASATNAFYKTWGGSIYSSDYIDFFNSLNSTEEWAYGEDPVSGVDLWTHFGIRYPEKYMRETEVIPGWPPQYIYPSTEDTLRAADLIRVLWLQSMREIGLAYAKPDYRVELSTGGPISKNATMFIAARRNVVNPFLPTGTPNVDQQVMSNITYQPNINNKIKFIYNYNNDFENGITSNYYRWFERVLNVTKETNTTHQFGLSWNHVLNKSTFFDIKISQLFTNDQDRIDLLSDTSYSEQYSTQINWRDYTAPTGYQVGKLQTSSGAQKTKTFSLNANINSQVNNRNLLKAGLQFFYYDIDVDQRLSAANTSQMRLESYRKFPYEGALYLQDKMEFEGLIANIGLRYDFYDLNTRYYTDKFSPYRNPNFEPGDISKGGFYDENLAAREDAKLKSILQPRVGISFPVSTKSVIHLNYGVFTQRPPFQYIFINRLKLEATPNYERLGNPQLEPEKTIAYDVGLVRALPFGLYLDVSAYLKDVSNLIQFAVYQDNGGNRYFTFDNREYADIKGFHINLEKNTGFFRWYIRYNWELATGKSASAYGNGARAEYFEDDQIDDILPSPEDIFIDYNRKHKLVANLSFRTSSQAGFKVWDIKPLSNISVSGTYRLSSGRPFTYDRSGQGLQMNMRTPTEHDLRVRLEKKIGVLGLFATLYLEGFNILNKQVYYYSRVFADPQNEQNILKERYMEDRENFRTQTDFAPYITSLDGYVFSNLPRHFRFGLMFDF